LMNAIISDIIKIINKHTVYKNEIIYMLVSAA